MKDGPWSTDHGMSDLEQSRRTTEGLQDGSHHGYSNKIVLAILNLHVTHMPPTKFWLNLTYNSGADEV